MANASTICGEMRSLAMERRRDWQSGDEQSELIIREEWRFWREKTLLSELLELQKEGHQGLQALLCDTIASYQELQPVVTREHDSFAARLSQLAAAAHAETLKLLPASVWSETSKSRDLAILLQEVGESELDSVWDRWYAEAEERFQADALRKEQLLQLRQKRAVRIIETAAGHFLLARKLTSKARREQAAARIQLSFRRFLARRRHLRAALAETRAKCLLWRLRRRLRRYILKRRTSKWVQLDVTSEAEEAATKIQSFCRGRWSHGWSYCWAPPLKMDGARKRGPCHTVEMARAFAKLRERRRARRELEIVRQAWIPALQPELLLLESWGSELVELKRREEFEARSLKRFEVQWQSYADGLEAFARSQGSKTRDHWVATADRDGKAVWMNERTGQIRNNDPTETRVRGAMSREKKKAEAQLEEHLASLRASWEVEDEAAAQLAAAGMEELQMISRSSFAQALADVRRLGASEAPKRSSSSPMDLGCLCAGCVGSSGP